MSVEKTVNFLLGHEFVEEIQNYILILYFHIQDRLKVRRQSERHALHKTKFFSRHPSI